MRGWKALTVLLSLIVVFCAIGTWTFITWIAPLIFSTAQLWPTGPDDLWKWLCIGGTVAGIVLGFAIDESTLWTDRLPLMSDAGAAASNTGAAIGILTSAITIAVLDPTDPLAILIIVAIGGVFVGFAWRRIRSTINETRAHHRDIDRMRKLHANGTRVRAHVVDVHFHNTWIGGFDPLFTVTAEYDTPSGPRQAEGRLSTSPADAPIEGGTVLLWYSDDGSDTENVDIEEDPDSIRDPDAAKTYEERMGG